MSKDAKHWRELSVEPNDPLVQQYLRDTLLKARKGRVDPNGYFLSEFVRGCSVLDIGVVGHSIERSYEPRWKHNLIREVATRVVGIDILEQPVLDLRNRGYDVRLVDATSDLDMGERFDRVVIGDVIEHVDNPISLLRFASRHLESGGRIICTTPNPFYIGNILDILRNGLFIANAEHITWITPTMALEIAHRSGLRLHSYWHAGGHGNSFLRMAMIALLNFIKIINLEFFARSYIYIFERS